MLFSSLTWTPWRCIGHRGTSGTFRMYILLAFVSLVSWVRDEISFRCSHEHSDIDEIFVRRHSAKDPDDRSLWISIMLGGLAMLAKESGLTVFIVNLIYDFYRNWSTLKKTIQDVRWNQDSYKFARRMFSVLVSMTVFLLARIALLQGSLPKFSQQDNPAAFHSSFQTRVLTFLYLSSFNLWLLICPSQLSHDWQMGSIPLILSLKDVRNILTFFTISAIICLVYKIYNDLEVSSSRHPRHLRLRPSFSDEFMGILMKSRFALHDESSLLFSVAKPRTNTHTTVVGHAEKQKIICENYWH